MVAIVIPYFKLTFFEATLQSLAAQKCKDFKVYIGDDASQENPMFLLEKYKGKFDFVYQRFEANLGSISLTQQWDRCIALSENEDWIMILGDDDVLSPNVMEEFYNNLAEIEGDKINVVRFSTQKIDQFGNATSGVFNHPKIENAVDFLFRNTRSSLSEYVFRKIKIDTFGFKNFPLAWFSDVLAVLEFSDFNKIYSINNAIAYIRLSDWSISGNQKNIKLKNHAAFEFYYYLLTKKSNFFSESQKIELIQKICKIYLNNKKKIIYFIKISLLLISHGLIIVYIHFVKSIVINFKNAPRL